MHGHVYIRMYTHVGEEEDSDAWKRNVGAVRKPLMAQMINNVRNATCSCTVVFGFRTCIGRKDICDRMLCREYN